MRRGNKPKLGHLRPSDAISDPVARVTFAVLGGACSIGEVAVACEISKSSAHKFIAMAKHAGTVQDLADSVEGGKRWGTLRPAVEIVAATKRGQVWVRSTDTKSGASPKPPTAT